MDAIETTVPTDMATTEAAVRTATLKAKLGVDRTPLKILGACNPGFADRALQLDPSVALLLPCNVVLRAVDGGTLVSAIDPSALMEGDEFAAVAADARAALAGAIADLTS
jgi:uncharacterized protein (DUF302 family)